MLELIESSRLWKPDENSGILTLAETYHAPGLEKARLTLLRADVTIIGDKELDTSTLTVTTAINAPTEDAAAEENAGRVLSILSGEKEVVLFEYNRETPTEIPRPRAIDRTVELTVPASSRLDHIISVGLGDVEVETIQGKSNIQVGDGYIATRKMLYRGRRNTHLMENGSIAVVNSRNESLHVQASAPDGSINLPEGFQGDIHSGMLVGHLGRIATAPFLRLESKRGDIVLSQDPHVR